MIEVGKFKSVYVIPRDHPWPHATRERLDALARRDLPGAFLRALTALGEARGDHSIWMLRDLQFEVDLNDEQDDDSIARLWAERLITALARRIDDPASGGMIRFDDEAGLLRSFLSTIASGRPREWYHGRYAGYEYLSTTAKIRTAVQSNPLVGLDALLGMNTRDLRLIVAALSENDARRVWDSLSVLMPAAPFQASLQVAQEVWPATGFPAPDGAGEFRWALHLALTALCDTPSDARAWLTAARPLGRLLLLLRDLDSETCGKIMDAIAAANMASLERFVTIYDAGILQSLSGCPRDLVEPFLERRATKPETPERRYTPFGGLFLLLPFLDAIPVPPCIQPASLFRFWILLKCLGSPRAVRVFEDPVARSLFSVDPALSADAFRRWQSGISTRWLRVARRLVHCSTLVRDNSQHRAPADRRYLRLPRLLSGDFRRDTLLDNGALLTLRSLAWRLPGFSTASLPHLFENFLDFPAGIEDHPERRLVRLGAPPLQLLLNMTGICRWQYTARWLDGRRFELYPEAP